jgi:hypothetical protein
VENADLLALRASAANYDDLLRRGDIYAFDGNRYTEYLRLKRQSEIVPDHRGKSLDKNNIGSRAPHTHLTINWATESPFGCDEHIQ